MPCTNNTCPNFTPDGDGSGEDCSDPCGVQYEKYVFPKWDTGRINVPDWQRDRVMYYYDDVCSSPFLHSLYGSGGSGDGTPTSDPPVPDSVDVQYGTSGVRNPYAGRVVRVIDGNYWWSTRDDLCPNYASYGRFSSIDPIPVRYWEHYPTEISFEAIRSDSWFYYLYKTESGVVGKPCNATCFHMYTLGFGRSGGTSYDTYYGIEKVPFDCECIPQQTYVYYDLEDGKITDDTDPDPYPLIWSCGTKSNRIAFKYAGRQISADVYVKAYGLIESEDVTKTLGPETLAFSNGASVNEVYTELGTVEKLLASNNLKYRYNAAIELRSGDTVLCTLQAVFRPFNGKGDNNRPDSKFKIVGIGLQGSNSDLIVSGTYYDMYVRSEKNPKKYIKLGEAKLNTITTSSVKPGVPIAFHMNEPIEVGPSDVGSTLSELGFYEGWAGTITNTYLSSQGDDLWRSKNTQVTQDFTLPGGTIIRMDIFSYWDDADEKYYTRWKINRIVRYGSNYTTGDGLNYTGQDVYYLYYPSPDAANKVGIALMVSATQDGDWSEGQDRLAVGDTINGWRVTNVKHTDDDFNMHIADIIGGTNDFQKDTDYTASSNVQVNVRAGYGISDRAIVMGKYEFQRKEIVYVTANADPEVPQEGLEVVKPKLQAIVANGKVVDVQILKPGNNLTNPDIEPIKIAIEYPPGYMNKDKYLEYITNGMDPDEAFEKSKGTSRPAKAEAVFIGVKLTSIKILDGGSGYSAEKPPFVAVPYIAGKFKTTHIPGKTTAQAEPDKKDVFDKSEAFNKMATTSYSYDSAVIDEKNPTKYQSPEVDAQGFLTGKNSLDTKKIKTVNVSKSGYTIDDYNRDASGVHSEKSTSFLKGSVKSLERQKNSQLYVRPKSGLSKESAQQFLPPSNPNKTKTKNSDYTELLQSVDKQVKNTASYFRKYSVDQQDLINEISPDLSLETPSFGLNDSFSASALNEASTVNLSVSNLDDGNYYGKEFKNFITDNNIMDAKELDSMLANVDKTYEANINGMWQMDLDENRSIVYDGAATKKVSYTFYNLPCATSKKKYMIKGYCPDPRKNTFMKITVGVKVAGQDYENDRGPCKRCLYEDGAVMSTYNSLVSSHGAGNVDIADAFCDVYYTPSYYSGQTNGTRYGIPFGSYTLPYAPTLFAGFNRAYVKSEFAPENYLYEGCHDYEFSGYLEILHDKTLETKTFVDAVNKYGNPYDFKCGRVYEDTIAYDEASINNIVGASEEFDPDAPAQLPDPIREELN